MARLKTILLELGYEIGLGNNYNMNNNNKKNNNNKVCTVLLLVNHTSSLALQFIGIRGIF